MLPWCHSSLKGNWFLSGFGGASGQNLRYLIRDCYRRDLACVLFGFAAWKVKARDLQRATPERLRADC